MALDLGELYGTIGLDDAPFQTSLDRAFDALAGFGGRGARRAAIIGAAISTALVVSLVQNISAEAATDKLAAQLGLTEAESARIGGVAGALYAQAYGQSMDEVQGAVAAVMSSIDGMREASTADLESMTARALDYAKAFEIDVSRAAQVAGQAVRAGLAEDGAQAFDLLVAASQKVPAALREDLLDAVDEYGPAFAQLGMDGEQAFALLVDASAKGMYGIDKAGDALKEFVIRSTDMSQASKDAYKAIGVDAEDMANAILAGGETAAGALDEIIGGLLAIKDPATQANTAIALFGTPIEDLNAGEIPAFLTSLQAGSDAMSGFGGAADRMGATLNDNATASLTAFKREAELAFMGLMNWALPAFAAVASAGAENLGPALAAIADGFAWVTEHLDNLLGPLGGLAPVATTLGVVLLTVVVPALITWGVTSTISGIKAAGAFLLAQAAAIRAGAVHVAQFAIMIGRWVALGAIAVAQAGRIAAAWLIQQGPMLVTVAMAAVNFALIAAGWIASGIAAMAGAAAMAAAWLVAIWPIALVVAAIAGIVALVVIYWDEIKAFTAAAWDWVVGLIRGAIDWIVQIFLNFTGPGLIIQHWETIKSTVSAGVTSVVSFVSGLPGKVIGALTGAKNWLVGVGEDIMRGIETGIENGLDWVADKLSGLGKLIPGWLKDVLGISSPSKVMRDQVGFWIPAGIAAGIDAGSPAVEAAMADLMSIPDVAMPLPTNLGTARVQGSDGTAVGGYSPTFQIYPAPGMSEEQIGRSASEHAQFVYQSRGRG